MFLSYVPKVKKQFGEIERLLNSKFVSDFEVNPNLAKDEFSETLNEYIYKTINKENKKFSQNFSFSVSEVIEVRFKVFRFFTFLLIYDIEYISKFVNPYFYKIRYPDVLFSRVDPVIHFWTHGYFEKRSPNPVLIPAIEVRNLTEFYQVISDENNTEYFVSCLQCDTRKET